MSHNVNLTSDRFRSRLLYLWSQCIEKGKYLLQKIKIKQKPNELKDKEEN